MSNHKNTHESNIRCANKLLEFMTLNIGDYPIRYITAGSTWEPVAKLREKKFLQRKKKLRIPNTLYHNQGDYLSIKQRHVVLLLLSQIIFFT